MTRNRWSPALSKTAALVVAIIIIIAVIGGAWWYLSQPTPTPTETTPIETTPPTEKTTPPTEETTPPAEETTPAGGFAGTILVGTTISEKGKYVHEGEQAKIGFLTAIKWVNEYHGGVKVGNKVYKLELKWYDDESSSDRVPELMSKLIEEDKVNFILLPYSSGLTKAAAPVVESHKVIGLSHGGASDTIFQAGYKYIVQVLSPASKYFESVVDMLAQQHDPDVKVALIYEKGAFAMMCASGAKAALEKAGIPVVYEFSYEKGAQEFGSVINEAMAAGANVLIGGGHFADSTALVSQAWQLGWKLKLVSVLVAPTLPEFYEQLQEAANCVTAPAQWEIGVAYSPEAASKVGLEWFGPTNEEYIKLFKEVSKEVLGKEMTPDYHAAEASATVLFLVKAIEDAGSIDTDAVREAMNHINMMTFFGVSKIDPETGLQIGHQMIVVQWQNGEKKIVWPPEAAQTEPIYPAPNWWER